MRAVITTPRPPTHDATASWSVYRPRGLRLLGYVRSGPAAPGLRYSPCTGLVTRAATSRRADARHGSTRAKPSVVGDVQRPRCSNALSILAAARLAPSRCRRPPPPDPGLLTEPAEPGSAPGPRTERRDAACSFSCPLSGSRRTPAKLPPTKLSSALLHARRSRAFSAAHALRQRLTQACAPGQPVG